MTTLNTSTTFAGTPEQLRRLLTAWEAITAEARVPAAPRQAREADESTVGRFVANLTTEGRRLAHLVCSASARNQPLSESDLWAAMKPLEEQEVNGVKGGIGIHWGRLFDTPNPFARQGQYGRGYYYQVDATLAAECLQALNDLDG